MNGDTDIQKLLDNITESVKKGEDKSFEEILVDTLGNELPNDDPYKRRLNSEKKLWETLADLERENGVQITTDALLSVYMETVEGLMDGSYLLEVTLDILQDLGQDKGYHISYAKIEE